MKPAGWKDLQNNINETWRYVKTGQCDMCPDDDAHLYTLRNLKGLRVVVPPLFCMKCRERYERGELKI